MFILKSNLIKSVNKILIFKDAEAVLHFLKKNIVLDMMGETQKNHNDIVGFLNILSTQKTFEDLLNVKSLHHHFKSAFPNKIQGTTHYRYHPEAHRIYKLKCLPRNYVIYIDEETENGAFITKRITWPKFFKDLKKDKADLDLTFKVE